MATSAPSTSPDSCASAPARSRAARMASGSASAWASSTARAIERLDLRSSGVGSTLAEPDAVTVPGAGAAPRPRRWEARRR
jgi:hypothetical protein